MDYIIEMIGDPDAAISLAHDFSNVDSPNYSKLFKSARSHYSRLKGQYDEMMVLELKKKSSIDLLKRLNEKIDKYDDEIQSRKYSKFNFFELKLNPETKLDSKNIVKEEFKFMVFDIIENTLSEIRKSNNNFLFHLSLGQNIAYTNNEKTVTTPTVESGDSGNKDHLIPEQIDQVFVWRKTEQISWRSF